MTEEMDTTTSSSDKDKEIADLKEAVKRLEQEKGDQAKMIEQKVADAIKQHLRQSDGLPRATADEDDDDDDNDDEFFSNTESGRFLAELRPILLGDRDKGKRLSIKGPDIFDGTFVEFRTWWERTKEYLHMNAPSVPTDKIKIQIVGTFMKGGALAWYQTRKRSMKTKKRADSWKSFKAAVVERFTDHMEKTKDWRRMKKLEYKGDIQTYLADLEEINSRVGATGEPLREVILGAITPDMLRAIYHHNKRIPDNDDDLIRTVKEIGIIEEEILLANQMRKAKTLKADKGKEADPPKKDTQKTPSETKTKDKKETGRTPTAKDFSHLTKAWASAGQALRNVDQASIDKWKAASKACIRCGGSNHQSVHCVRRKNLDGMELPPPPTNPPEAKVAAITKRKRQETPRNEAEFPPDDKGDKKPKTLALAAAQAQKDIWFVDESGGESPAHKMDF